MGASLVAALVGQSAFGQGTSGTWTTAGNGTWSTTSNWSGGTVANGAGALANFGTVDLTANATITLDTNRTIGRLIFGDTGWTSSTSLFNWTLQSGTLTLDNTGGTGGNPPSITINTGTTTISSVLAGSNGLSLAMPWSNYDDTRGTSVAAGNDMNSQTTGGLTFTGSNTLSGTLSASGGTVRVGGSAGRFGSVTALSVTGNGTFLNGDATAATNNGITNRIGDGTATLSLGGSSGGGVYTSAFAASGTTSQTFARLTINAGQNAINTANTAAGTNNLIFTGGTNGAGYVRNVNGIVNVVPATGFNPQFTNAPTAAGGSSVSGSGGNEILIGALLNGTDFIRATSGTLVAATYTTNGATSLTAGANINITGTNTTLSGSTTLSVNSIKFTDNAARTLDLGTGSALTVASGGILTGTAVATTGNTITGGSITSGQSDLWIYANGSTLGNVRNAGNALTIASQVTGSISVTVGGGSGPTVAGQQVVFSNASNDYAGGTFLVGGALVVAADGALGSTSGTVTAVSGLNYLAPTASFTFNANRNFVVNSGAALFIGDRGQTNTIAGNLSGGGQFGPGYVSNGQRLNLTGSNSGFTGQYMVNGYLGATEGTSLSSNANLMFTGRDQLNLGVLETSGTFSRALGSGAGQVQWQNRSGYGGGGFAAVGGALTVNIGGNVTPDTLTFASGYFIPANGALNLGTSVSTADLTFLNPINLNGAQRAINVAASGTTKATMSGVISGTGSSGILKGDPGTLVLSGSNTYQGKTWISSGTLSVSSINSVTGGSASSNLGAPTTAANATIDLGSGGAGGLNNAGLTYTGSGETTDRVLNMLATIGQITLTQSGTGLLKFTSNVTSGAMRPTDMSTALILAGSTSGTGEISGIIADTTMTGTVTVAASTGATTLTVPAGSLSVNAGWQRANILVSGSGIAPGSRWTAYTSGTGTLNVATTADIAANQPITLTGVNSIQKTGTGTWVLSGNNTYTGPTTVSAGVLSVASLANGGSSSNIGASTNAAGNLVLGGGSLQYTGATVTTDRSFTLTASTTSTIDVSTAGTTLTFTGSTTATTGALTKAGAGTLALAGAAAYTGATAINAGTLQIGNGGTTGGLSSSSAISIASGATLAFSRTDDYGGAFANTISGSGALTLLSGSLTLSKANTYTGQTTVSNGVLIGGTTNAFGSSAPLAVNSGTVNLGGFSQAVGALSGSAGTLVTTATGAGSATLTTTFASGTSTFAGSIANNVSGTVAFTKAGAGTLTLSGSNGYTGATTVNGGVLSVSSLANGGVASNIGASSNVAGNLVLGGGSLQYTGATVSTDRAFTLTASTTSTIDVSTAGTALTFTGSTTNTTGALTKAGAGTLALAGAAAYTGATAINAGTLQIGNGGTTGGLSSSSAVTIASAATLAFNRTDNYGGNFANTISGSGALTLLSGSLTFSTANTYTGQTTVNGGVLLGGIANAFGSSAPLAVNSGTVNLAGFSQSVGALSGSAGTLITTSTGAGSATLTTTFASGTSTFAGSIANNVSGTVAFTKAGAGTQVFAGDNTYTGTTSVNAGTLQIGNGSTTGALSASSVITGSTGATLAFNRTDNYGGNVANTIGGGLGLSLLSGSLTLSATNTYTGDTSINSGRLEIASTGRLGGGTYAGAINNNGAFVYSGTNAQTLSGLITGSGAFTNNASSTLTLSGTMSLSGASNAISTTTNGAIDLTAQLSTAPGSLLTFTVGGGASTGPIRLYGASNTIQGEVLVTGGSGAGSSLVWLNTSGVNSLSGATKITVASGNTLRYWSASVGAGTAFDLNGTGNNFRGALSFYDSGTSTLSGPVNLSGNSQIVSRNASLTLGGNITESGGARSLTITADSGGATTQVYTLSGSNSFSGGLTLNGGDFAGFSAKLVAGSATAFGSGPLALNSLTQATATAVVDLNGQAITVGGLSGGNLANANSFIQSDSGAAVLTVNQATNDTFSGVIRNGSGSVALTKTGNATLTLSGSNTYTGQTTVNGGVLAAGIANAFGSSAPLAVNSGTVNLAGFSQSVGALSGSSGALITTANAAGVATLTTTFASGTSTFAGSIANNVSGTVAFTKAGAGTQILSGTNTFSGATSIAAGVLSITGTSALQGTSGLTIAGGAGLTYTGGAATFSKPVTVTAGSGTGTIWNSGGGLLTLAGNLSKDNSVLRLAGGAFNVTGTISGATVGASDLVVAGTSSVTLSAANTYNGPTFVIESSTLTYGINNAIPSNSVVTLGNASSQGTLSMNGFTGAIGGLAFGTGGGTLRLAATSTSAAPLTAASGTMRLTGGTLDLAGSGSTAGLYRVLSAQSIGGSFASITGTSAAYQVITSATSVDYQQRAVLGAVTVTNPVVSIITGGSAAFTYTVANSALSGGASLAFTGANLSNVTGSSSGSVAAAGTSSSVSGLFFNGTTVGSGQQGTFTVSAPTAYGATTATGTVSVNVLDHSNAALALASGGGQTIITGGSLGSVTFNLTNAGTGRSALDVSTLSNLSGTTGSAVVASNGSATYTASGFNTTAVGQNKTLTVSLSAGDQQTLSGASAMASYSGTATYTVLDHSNAALALASGGGQTIITGGSLGSVTFNLTNSGSNLSALDVNTLSNLSGTTGSAVVASNGSASYTYSGATSSSLGSNTLSVSLKAGDQQSLSGASALQTLSGSTTYTVLDHSNAAFSLAGGNNQTIITGGSLGSVTFNLTNAGTGRSALDVSTLSNLSGTTGSAVVASNGSATYTASGFNTTAVGQNKTLTVSLSAGDQQTLSGASALASYSGTATYTVLDHSNAALALASGGGQTIITGGSFAGVGFNLTNAGSNRSAVQVNSLTNLVGGTGTAVVLSGGTGSYTASILDTTTIGTGTLSVGMLAGDQQSLSGASALQSLTSSATYTVLDHALPGFLATGIADPYAQATLNIDFGTIDERDGVQSFTFSLINLASQSYGAGLTAGLDFTSVTPNGGGFASGLSTFTNLVGGGTSSLYTFTYTPSGQGTFSKNFTLSFTDNQNLSGAAVRRDLTISAQVIVVPEPGTLALAGLGIALAGWAVATRRRQQTP